jgi:hypothetical protein
VEASPEGGQAVGGGRLIDEEQIPLQVKGNEVELPGIEAAGRAAQPPGGEMAPGLAGQRHVCNEVVLIARCANQSPYLPGPPLSLGARRTSSP